MYTNAFSLLALAGVAQAHMSLWYPPPLGGAKEANPLTTTVDLEFNFPLGCCDDQHIAPSPGLCRGHLDLYDTEEAQVTWEAGQDAYWQMSDYTYDPVAPGGTHSGGSCQVGFSTDRGDTWKVAASYNGNCPHGLDGSPDVQTFDFKVPTGMPEGDALFGWIWLNREHESFMGCSKVKIGAGSGSSSPVQSQTPSETSAVQSQEPSKTSAVYTAPEEPTQSADAPTVPDEDTPVVTVTQVVTSYVTEPTAAPEEEEEEESATTTRASRSHRPRPTSSWDQSQNKQKRSKWSIVDGCKCECRGGQEDSLSASCVCNSCDSSETTRASVERKALRMHRRSLQKRVSGCDWDSAPSMEVSYFTSDADCAPSAKARNPESDTFEIGWDFSCGVVDGKGEYPIKMMECDMY
ncbi:lytic polysaccharide monooxygenase [Dothidotthia symphoricarpi CBS 119687]|uniref:Lytic polysaccharide monooxygenase n=1 Tax=Dothidotthia symphoricarpi CBS 119687 TaxID=1392245 RepID=A0A6A6A125_9PLEO|nr:lytic polysaccharide monooxygenase [Dothidotthia symphoricarpi CBS 119687]KAF2124854.1 lytic polysaccharide monooxygenase [Dothidotthia symphoricarpi CBS 119687]